MDVRLEKRIRAEKGTILKILIFLLFGLLAMRAFQIQILEGERYMTLADGNRVRIIRVLPLRGMVYDHSKQILADNAPSFTVSVTYADMRQREQEIELLNRLMGIERTELDEILTKAKKTPFEPYPLVRDASIELVSLIEEHSYDLPGVKTIVEPIRWYPNKYLGSHFLGYMGEVSPTEYDRLKQDGYKSGDQIGKMGLEKQYEAFLRGKNGYEYMEVDVWGRELNQLTEKPPVAPTAGNDLYLTIDVAVQDTLMRLLSQWRSGAGVALDPQTGGVLAFASVPSFDANLFTSGISRKDWKILNEDPLKPLFNRAEQGTYPPGSTFKLLTALVGLEQNYTSPDNYMPSACGGGYQVGNRYFNCWKQTGHGGLAMVGAVTQSCDVYFYQLGLRLPLQTFHDYAKQAGFGKPSGVDLPHEAGGFFPSEDWAKKELGNGRTYPKGLLANLAIGQGEVLTTPIQLARFFGAIGNGGVLHTPYFVDRIVSPTGELISQTKLEPGFLSVSKKNLQVLDQACFEVVNSAFGTGGQARVPGYDVCGKTGTAQNPHGEDHAWFVGYAPRYNPRIVVAIIVENSGHGGSIAAPIAGKILKTYIEKQGIPPQLPKPVAQIPTPKPSITADNDTLKHSLNTNTN